MEPERRYRGHRILRCHWAGDPHGGRWYVQARHESGMQWADEDTPHHRTLADAREYIDASLLDRMDAGSGWDTVFQAGGVAWGGWDDDTTEAIARAVGLIA